jgi:hypothetical protein
MFSGVHDPVRAKYGTSVPLPCRDKRLAAFERPRNIRKRRFQVYCYRESAMSPPIFNHSRKLQLSRRFANARSTCTKHCGKLLLGERNAVQSNSILRHQEPSSQTLFDLVQSVTGRDLLRFQQLQVGEARQKSFQHWKFRQQFVESLCLDSKRLSRDLNFHKKRGLSDVQKYGQSDKPLVADKTNLNTGVVPHYRKARDQPSV